MRTARCQHNTHRPSHNRKYDSINYQFVTCRLFVKCGRYVWKYLRVKTRRRNVSNMNTFIVNTINSLREKYVAISKLNLHWWHYSSLLLKMLKNNDIVIWLVEKWCFLNIIPSFIFKSFCLDQLRSIIIVVFQLHISFKKNSAQFMWVNLTQTSTWNHYHNRYAYLLLALRLDGVSMYLVSQGHQLQRPARHLRVRVR